MSTDFDVIVAGGSVGGLTFAAEACTKGLSVLVAEEHQEIGEPEKCDGLVSLRGLRRLGHPPEAEVVQNGINTGLIHSPSGRDLAINATSLEVVVLDRSLYDKQLARTAVEGGATLRTGTRVRGSLELGDGIRVDVGGKEYTAKYYVDATGPSSSPKSGILPAAKYELEADWVRERVVEVFLDVERFPGFFAWIIPYGRHLAKVGAAGRGISPFKALDAFLKERPHRVLRRVSAPIYIGGPAPDFAEGRRVRVGESAGQVKPTTAGGIMTSVAGATLAAKWLAESIKKNDPRLVANYRRSWDSMFGKEVRNMGRVRGVFEKLSNPDLDAIIGKIATPRLVLKLSQSDFDLHASALLGALGVAGILSLARVVASAEVRSLVAETRAP